MKMKISKLDIGKSHEDHQIVLEIILLFLLSRMSFVLIGLLFNSINHVDYNLPFLINKWDAAWYSGIINQGYMKFPNAINMPTAAQANWAFSPLYPIAVTFFKTLFFLPTNVAGPIVSNICIVIASYYGVKYYRICRPGEDYTSFLFLVFLGPYAFYFSSMYAEALFFLFIVLFLYQLKRRNYILAGVFSGLSSATRLMGVFLVFILLFELYRAQFDEFKLTHFLAFIKSLLADPSKVLSILLCPLGAFIYMIYLYKLVGDVWASVHILRAWQDLTGASSFLEALSGKNGLSLFYVGMMVIVGIIIVISLLLNHQYDEFILGAVIVSTHFSSVHNIARHSIGMVFAVMGLSILINKFPKYKSILYTSLSAYEFVLVYCWYSQLNFLI